MATRRQERVARVIKEAVYDAVANHLNDPRIKGFVSVTRVDVAVDLRVADVYFSIFGGDETSQRRTFIALEHARSRIQSFVAGAVKSKFCPVLRLHKDEKLKKALEIIRIIDQSTGQPDDEKLTERREGN